MSGRIAAHLPGDRQGEPGTITEPEPRPAVAERVEHDSHVVGMVVLDPGAKRDDVQLDAIRLEARGKAADHDLDATATAEPIHQVDDTDRWPGDGPIGELARRTCERRPVPALSAPRGGRFAERPGSLRISEQFGNGGSQRGRVLGRHEHASGSELLPRPREVRRDDRSPECHRLQHDKGEGLGPARQGEDIRPGDLDGTVLDLSEPVDRTRRDRRRRAADPTPFGVQPVRRSDGCRQGEDVSALSVVGDTTGDDEWASTGWLLHRRRASEQRCDVDRWSQDDDGLLLDAESRRQHLRRLR